MIIAHENGKRYQMYLLFYTMCYAYYIIAPSHKLKKQ